MKNNISGAVFGCVLLILFGLFGILGSIFIINTQRVENATLKLFIMRIILMKHSINYFLAKLLQLA